MDPLLIVITSKLQIALALQGDSGKRNLLMRSDYETLHDLLNMLNSTTNHLGWIEIKEYLGVLTGEARLGKIF